MKRHPEYDHLAATCKSMEVEVEIEKIQVDMEADGKFFTLLVKLHMAVSMLM